MSSSWHPTQRPRGGERLEEHVFAAGAKWVISFPHPTEGVEANQLQKRYHPNPLASVASDPRSSREGGEWLQLKLQEDNCNLFARSAPTPSGQSDGTTRSAPLRFFGTETYCGWLMGRENLRIGSTVCLHEMPHGRG